MTVKMTEYDINREYEQKRTLLYQRNRIIERIYDSEAHWWPWGSAEQRFAGWDVTATLKDGSKINCDMKFCTPRSQDYIWLSVYRMYDGVWKDVLLSKSTDRWLIELNNKLYELDRDTAADLYTTELKTMDKGSRLQKCARVNLSKCKFLGQFDNGLFKNYSPYHISQPAELFGGLR